MAGGRIRVGVGGWTYAPWRGAFFPAGLPHAQELDYASRHLSSIEINGTFYRTPSPQTYAKWHDESAPDVIFALKAPRYATNRKVLAEAGESVARFVASGLAALGEKLGPINWQLAPTKRFDPDDFTAFLDLLPGAVEGQRLRHAVEVRHESFAVPEVVALARARGVALVVAGDADYPQIADPTADFVYARIMGTEEAHPAGYADAALDLWAKRAKAWARGVAPAGLRMVGADKAEAGPRDVYLYVISGFKARNPAAAMGLIARLA